MNRVIVNCEDLFNQNFYKMSDNLISADALVRFKGRVYRPVKPTRFSPLSQFALMKTCGWTHGNGKTDIGYVCRVDTNYITSPYLKAESLHWGCKYQMVDNDRSGFLLLVEVR